MFCQCPVQAAGESQLELTGIILQTVRLMDFDSFFDRSLKPCPLGIQCISHGIFHCLTAGNAAGEIGIRNDKATFLLILEQAREDGIDFVAWQEYKNKRVTNVDGTGAASANVLEFSGSSELLALERHLPQEDVAKSCLIGERTAEELYGSRSARGNILCYEGREYTVQGVLREPGNLVVLQNDDENAGFGRLTIAPEEGRSRGRTAEQFLAGYGLDGRQLRYDMLGLSYFVEQAPGKWSDFAQVKQSALKMQDDIVCLLETEKSSIELLWFRDVGLAVTGFLAGFVLLWRQFPTRQTKK